MRKEEVEEIDGYEYAFTQFAPKKSLKILTRLGKILGKPLASMMSSEDALNKEVDMKFFGQAVFDLTSSMGEDELYEIMTDLCESVAVMNGTDENPITGKLKGSVFDTHFSDKKGILRMMKVGKKALEVNYGDFLEEIAGFAAAQRSPASKKSTSAE